MNNDDAILTEQHRLCTVLAERAKEFTRRASMCVDVPDITNDEYQPEISSIEEWYRRRIPLLPKAGVQALSAKPAQPVTKHMFPASIKACLDQLMAECASESVERLTLVRGGATQSGTRIQGPVPLGARRIKLVEKVIPVSKRIPLRGKSVGLGG